MKKKNRTIGIIFGVLLFIGIVGIFILWNRKNVSLKSDELFFEYGEEIVLENEDLLDTKDPEILESLIIDDSNIVLEEDKNYPEVGEYDVSVRYDRMFQTILKDIKIIVSDTTAPEFVEAPEKIKLAPGELEYNLESYFIVEDLSDFELIIETDSVHFEELVEYEAQAIARDQYENEAIHNFILLVSDREEELEESDDIIDATDPNNVTPTVKEGILVVNKRHPLPADYNPGEDPTALAQLKKLIGEMQDRGYDIGDHYSGFRTYDYQKELYNRYVKEDGKEAADTYSARPGHSEHQTGLTFDVTHQDGTLVKKDPEAAWLAEHAADYGFIVRYTKGKEEITGYKAEPWHLRYIGEEAQAIEDSGLSLEEYLGVEGGDYPSNE